MCTCTYVCVILICDNVAGIDCQPCDLNSIKVAQSRTGKTVQNKPEWKVSITNDCICTQTQVVLDCTGFRTVKPVAGSILSVTGSRCLVNNGQPVLQSQPISFTYAWDSSFSFSPVSSLVSCS